MSKEILLLGEFSTGKSAFINMLLGVSILPERLEPTDMPVVKICESKPTGFFLREKGQKNPLTLDNFSDIPNNWDMFEYAEISIKGHPLLEQGLILWDTPGINSTNVNHQKHLDKFLNNSMRDFELIIYFDRGNLTSTKLNFLKKNNSFHNKLKIILNIHENISREDSSILLKQAQNIVKDNGINCEVSLLSIGNLVDKFNIESEKMRTKISDWDLIKEWGKRKIYYKDLIEESPEEEMPGLTVFDQLSDIASIEPKNVEYYSSLDDKSLIELCKNGDDKANYEYARRLFDYGDLEKWVTLLMEAAKSGNSDAQYELAEVYKGDFFYISLTKDIDLYNKYLSLAIQNNNPRAIAHSYTEGFERCKDPVLAFNLLKNEYEKGNVRVIQDLVRHYSKGIGTDRNMNVTEQILRANFTICKTELVEFLLESESIEKKKEGLSILNSIVTTKVDFWTALILFNLYNDGDNDLEIPPDRIKAYEVIKPFKGKNSLVDFAIGRIFLEVDQLKNVKEGLQLVESAYNQGLVYSGLFLYECYKEGIGTRVEEDNAFRIILDLCKDEIPEAKRELGIICFEYDWTFSDGLRLLNECAEKGDSTAAYFLALYYQKSDVGKSIRLLLDTYDEKDKDINSLLGELYLETKNYSQAIIYLKKASDLGEKDAQRLLGECYLRGLGVNKNVSHGFCLLELAAENGSVQAMEELADQNFMGNETQKDINKSNNFLKKAVDHGSVIAQFELGKRYLLGIGLYKNEKMGIELIEKAAKDGHPEAIYSLGLFHLKGTHLEKNLLRAKSYFEEALELGFKEAMDPLSEIIEHLKKGPYARWTMPNDYYYQFEVDGELVTELKHARFANDLIVYYKDKNCCFMCPDYSIANNGVWLEAKYIGDTNLTFYAEDDEKKIFVDFEDDFGDDFDWSDTELYKLDNKQIILNKKSLISYIIPDYDKLEYNKIYPVTKVTLKWIKTKENAFRLMRDDECLWDGKIVNNYYQGNHLICEVSDFVYNVSLINFAVEPPDVWHPAIFVAKT